MCVFNKITGFVVSNVIKTLFSPGVFPITTSFISLSMLLLRCFDSLKLQKSHWVDSDAAFLFVADFSPCAGQQTYKTEWYVAVFHCCWLSLSLTGFEFETALNVKSTQKQPSLTFSVLVSFVHTDAPSCVFRPTPPSPVVEISPFSHTISTGLAPTRAEELLTFKPWPFDMLTVDDLCWCRCYVKSAPSRPHSAGAHLDCTQAGKTLKEALSSSPHSFLYQQSPGFKLMKVWNQILFIYILIYQQQHDVFIISFILQKGWYSSIIL